MKYYCIGIKGSGMATLANILHDLGHEVSGYDDARETKYTEEGLNKRGIKIYYDQSHELDKDLVVTYSAAFSQNHPELVRVKELGLEIKSYNDLLGDLTRMFNSTSVCGTHGKTTTSLLISHILSNTLGCNYFVGDGSGFADTKNDKFVIESCEYNKHFLAYSPTNVVLTNIELEHTECFDGLEDIIKTFNIFVDKANDLVVMCGDDENVRKINTNNKVVYYGFNDNNNLVAKNVVLDETGSKYDAYLNGELLGHFDLPLFGRHMVLNSLAAIMICLHYGVSVEDINKHMQTFKGAKRRFKEKFYGDIVIVDDYAHHPTEISVTIDSARQKYPNKEVVAIFLPNTYSRTEALLDDFVTVLNKADTSYIMDIHCDREDPNDYNNVSSDLILERLTNGYKLALDNVNDLLKHENAVLCFMSCTNIYVLEDAYEKLLQEKSQ